MGILLGRIQIKNVINCAVLSFLYQRLRWIQLDLAVYSLSLHETRPCCTTTLQSPTSNHNNKTLKGFISVVLAINQLVQIIAFLPSSCAFSPHLLLVLYAVQVKAQQMQCTQCRMVNNNHPPLPTPPPKQTQAIQGSP